MIGLQNKVLNPPRAAMHHNIVCKSKVGDETFRICMIHLRKVGNMQCCAAIFNQIAGVGHVFKGAFPGTVHMDANNKGHRSAVMDVAITNSVSAAGHLQSAAGTIRAQNSFGPLVGELIFADETTAPAHFTVENLLAGIAIIAAEFCRNTGKIADIKINKGCIGM